MTNTKPTRPINKGKAVFFKILLVTISLLLLLIIEIGLRIFSVGDNLNLFISNPHQDYSEYNIVNPKIGSKYFQKLEYTLPRNDIFLKDKPYSCIRIMVMGSSSVFGFPYDANLSYPRILHKMLEDAYPNYKVEVINTAITAVNSFTLRDYIDEIIEQEPDAILFYAGHNEFYGAFGIGSNETMSRNKLILNTHLKLMNLSLYQSLQKAIRSVGKSIAQSKNKSKGTLMKRIVKDKDIEYQGDDYNIAKSYFHDNLSIIFKKARKNNIPVFVSNVVSNVKDLAPFNSIEGNNEQSALHIYHQAQKALVDSNLQQANKLFKEARDLDGIRFRASEEFNEIILSLTDQEGIYPVNMVEAFEKNSEDGIIGNDLMTEHVHPNLKGYFLMANTFFQSINNSNVLNIEPSQNSPSLQYYLNTYGYTSLDILTGYHRVALLMNSWPFTNDETKVNAYRDFYTPTSPLDSIAFNVMKFTDIKLEDEHLKLADIYKQKGDYLNAYREFEALIRINPYLAINYRDAATQLLQLNELSLALKYFLKSLEFEQSFYAQFKVGEIHLLKGDYPSAIKSFEIAYKLAPAENRLNVMMKLFLATSYNNNIKKAEIIGRELKKASPNINLTLPQKKYMYTNYIPFMVAEELEEAGDFLNITDYKSAELVITRALNKWHTPLLHRRLGEVYLYQKNYPLAIKHFNQVYSEFRFDPQFLHNYLLLYLTLQEKELAMTLLEEIKQVSPEYNRIQELEKLLHN